MVFSPIDSYAQQRDRQVKDSARKSGKQFHNKRQQQAMPHNHRIFYNPRANNKRRADLIKELDMATSKFNANPHKRSTNRSKAARKYQTPLNQSMRVGIHQSKIYKTDLFYALYGGEGLAIEWERVNPQILMVQTPSNRVKWANDPDLKKFSGVELEYQGTKKELAKKGILLDGIIDNNPFKKAQELGIIKARGPNKTMANKLTLDITTLFDSLPPMERIRLLSLDSKELEKTLISLDSRLLQMGKKPNLNHNSLYSMDLPTARQHYGTWITNTTKKTVQRFTSPKQLAKDAAKTTFIDAPTKVGKASWAVGKETVLFEFVVGLFTYIETMFWHSDNPAAVEHFWNNLKDPVARASFATFIAGSHASRAIGGLLTKFSGQKKFRLAKELRRASGMFGWLFNASGLAVGSVVSGITHEFFHHHAWKTYWKTLSKDGSKEEVQMARQTAKDELWKYFTSSSYWRKQVPGIMGLMVASSLSHSFTQGGKIISRLNPIKGSTAFMPGHGAAAMISGSRAARAFQAGLTKTFEIGVKWNLIKMVGIRVTHAAKVGNFFIGLVVQVVSLAAFMFIEKVINPLFQFADKTARKIGLHFDKKELQDEMNGYNVWYDKLRARMKKPSYLDRTVTVDTKTLKLVNRDNYKHTEIKAGDGEGPGGTTYERVTTTERGVDTLISLEDYITKKEDYRATLGMKAQASLAQWQEVLNDYDAQRLMIQEMYSKLIGLVVLEKTNEIGNFNTELAKPKKSYTLDDLLEATDSFTGKETQSYIAAHGLPYLTFEEFRVIPKTIDKRFIKNNLTREEFGKRIQLSYLSEWARCNESKEREISQSQLELIGDSNICPSVTYISPPIRSYTAKEIKEEMSEDDILLLSQVSEVGYSDTEINEWDFLHLELLYSEANEYMYAATEYMHGGKFTRSGEFANYKEKLGAFKTDRAIDYFYASMVCGPNPNAYYTKSFSAYKSKAVDNITRSTMGKIVNYLLFWIDDPVDEEIPDQIIPRTEGPTYNQEIKLVKQCIEDYYEKSNDNPVVYLHELSMEERLAFNTNKEYISATEGYIPRIRAPRIVEEFSHNLCSLQPQYTQLETDPSKFQSSNKNKRMVRGGGFENTVRQVMKPDSSTIKREVRQRMATNNSLFWKTQGMKFTIPTYLRSDGRTSKKQTFSGLFNVIKANLKDDLIEFEADRAAKGGKGEYYSRFQEWWMTKMYPDLEMGLDFFKMRFKYFIKKHFVPLYITRNSPGENFMLNILDDVILYTEMAWQIMKNTKEAETAKKAIIQIRKSLHSVSFSQSRAELDKHHELIIEARQDLIDAYHREFQEQLVRFGDVWIENPATQELELSLTAYTSDITEVSIRTAIMSNLIKSMEDIVSQTYGNVVTIQTLNVFEPELTKVFVQKQTDKKLLRKLEELP